MDIVDSQVHIWGADTPERPWPAGRGPEAQKPYPISAGMPSLSTEGYPCRGSRARTSSG
jgi:hypothetical protein